MRWLAVTLIILQTATCGQKGPLTLPERPAAVTAVAPASAI
ncbi:MAG: lipoprotein [Pseudomonadales bacterium]